MGCGGRPGVDGPNEGHFAPLSRVRSGLRSTGNGNKAAEAGSRNLDRLHQIAIGRLARQPRAVNARPLGEIEGPGVIRRFLTAGVGREEGFRANNVESGIL